MKKAAFLVLLGLAAILLAPAKASPGIAHDFVTLHSCDSASGVTPLGDASVSVNSRYYKEGAGALNVYKPYTARNFFGIRLQFAAPQNFRDKLIVFWLYASASAVPKIANIRLNFTDSSGNYGYRDVSPSILSADGWKSIVYMVPFRYQGGFYLTDPPFGDLNYRTSTYPDVTKIVRVDILFYTPSPSTTVDEGELVIDWVKLGRSIVVTEGIVGNLFTRLAQYDKQNALGVIDYMDGSVLIKGAQIVIGDGVASYTCSSYGESVAIVSPQESLAYIYVRRFSKLVIGQQITGKLGKDGSVFNIYGSPYFNYLFQGEDITNSYLEVWQGAFNFYNTVKGRNNGMFVNNINAKIYNAVFTNAYTGAIYRSNYELYNVVTMRGEEGIRGGTCLGLENYWSLNDTAPITFEYSQRATVKRLTAKSNTYLVRLFSFFGNVTLLDTVTDSFDRYWTGTASQNTGTVYLAFTFSPRLVDASGNPMAGARVRLVSSQGSVVYDDYTNASGYAPAKVVASKVWKGNGQTGVNADTETDNNPFTLEVYRDNYKVYSAKITILSPFTQDVAVAYAVSPRAEVGKSYYSVNEPATIYAQFSDLSGVRITGLAVNAYVTMPNGDVRLVPLRDDGVSPDQVAGDGIYTGLFAETHLVGTYYVDVEAAIYGGVFGARASFDVGKLEELIASVNATLASQIKSVNGTVRAVNGTLSRQISSLNGTVTGLNSTLSRQIASLNGTVRAVNGTLSEQIASVKSAVAASTNAIASMLSEIKGMLSQISVDFTPVLKKVDQATSTILDAIAKVSNQIQQLQGAQQQAYPALPPWLPWLVIAQTVILIGLLLAVKGRAPAPRPQPRRGRKVAVAVLAAVLLVSTSLLLARFSPLLPLALALLVALAAAVLFLGVKRALALAALLGLAYLAWTGGAVGGPASAAGSPPPVVPLAVGLLLLAIVYVALRRRGKRREAITWRARHPSGR
jgi:hypothetical protein